MGKIATVFLRLFFAITESTGAENMTPGFTKGMGNMAGENDKKPAM